MSNITLLTSNNTINDMRLKVNELLLAAPDFNANTGTYYLTNSNITGYLNVSDDIYLQGISLNTHYANTYAHGVVVKSVGFNGNTGIISLAYNDESTSSIDLNIGSSANVHYSTVTANTFFGKLEGNSKTASNLLNAFYLNLSGDVSGNTSIDGSKDVDLSVNIPHWTSNSSSVTIDSPLFVGNINGVNIVTLNTGFSSHTANTSNPHSVTAAQVGLGNVTNESKTTLFSSPTFTGTVSGVTKSMVGLGNADNTSDVNKPISTAAQSALDLKAPLASPTFTGSATANNLSVIGTLSVTSNALVTNLNADLLDGQHGTYYTANSVFAAHTSNTANPHSVTAAQVGLGNVDNTSDVNKPVSTATQTALNLKADKSITISAGTGLSGGGDLSAARTISLATSGVTANTYGSSTSVPVITVDSYGRITSANTIAVDNADRLDGYHASYFQQALVSNTNIKTINGKSLLGTGDITVDSYTATGTGAVKRYIQEKLDEIVSVLDFGADPTGINDSASAIQLAMNKAASVAAARTDSNNNTFGSIPYVYFPKGLYKISQSITNPSTYVNIFGEQAILFKNPTGFTGTSAFAFNNVLPASKAWRVNIEGIQFQEFTIALNLANANLNSGSISVSKCSFSSHVTAIVTDCKSSITLIENCIFRGNEHELEIISGDLVIIRGGWLKRGTLTSNYDGGIINNGVLVIEDVLGVPNTQTVVEPAWIKNYGSLKINNARFGGETGQGCIVNNYAAAILSFPIVPKYVKICNSEVYVDDTTAIRLFEIPNQIIISDNSGWATGGSTHIAWSSTVDSSAQAAKIAAIPSPDNGSIIQIEDSGNTTTPYNAWPENLLSFVNSKLHQRYYSFDGQNYPITIEHELTDTTIGSSDTYAKYDFIGFDNTTNASGIRAQMRVIGESTSGAAGFVFATANSASAVSDALRITSQKSIAIPDGITEPSTISSWAQIYIDASVGDLNVKFGDGTKRTIVPKLTSNNTIITGTTTLKGLGANTGITLQTVNSTGNTTFSILDNGSITTSSGALVTNLNSDYLDGQHGSYYAPLASPTFTGSVTMPGTGVWNSSGNVGIGTTSPSTKLHVAGDVTITDSKTGTASTAITTTTQTSIYSFATASYRTAKFVVQIVDSTNSQYHSTEILLIHDGTTVSLVQYGSVYTAAELGSFDATITSGTLNLYFTASAATTKTVKVLASVLAA